MIKVCLFIFLVLFFFKSIKAFGFWNINNLDALVITLNLCTAGHVFKFKALSASGLVPKQGKLIADRIDGIW